MRKFFSCEGTICQPFVYCAKASDKRADGSSGLFRVRRSLVPAGFSDIWSTEHGGCQ
jgi:hypothetical protein